MRIGMVVLVMVLVLMVWCVGSGVWWWWWCVMLVVVGSVLVGVVALFQWCIKFCGCCEHVVTQILL